MENPNLLQKPGGLGPIGSLKPLGMSAAAPQTYLNNESSISYRRGAYMDDVNRVFAQYNIDAGDYMRAPVDPLPYQMGNVVKSQQLTGPAGYNHNGTMPMPGKADDLTDLQYVQGVQNSINPQMRQDVATLTMVPHQRFLSKVTAESIMPQFDERMPDNLSVQEQLAKKEGTIK